MAKGIRPFVRPRWFRWRVVAPVVALAVLPYAAFEGYRAWLRTDPEWRFVEEALLDNQYRDERAVARWAGSPTIVLVDAAEDDEAFVRALVSEFNDVLRGSGVVVRLGEYGASSAQIVFTPRNSFPSVARRFGARVEKCSSGYSMSWTGERSVIEAGVALVASELTGDERRATIVHELMHVLGPANHSAVFAESVIFADGAALSSATGLAPIDRRLLRLLYMHLKPGYGWWRTRSAYHAFWTD